MAWLRTGTVTTVNGSTAVVGVQTLWVTQAKSGDLFTLDGDRLYEIDTITDDTHLTLKTPFLGVGGSAQSYAIIRNFTSTLPAQLAQQLAQLMADYHVTLDELTAWLSGVGTVTVHDGAGNAYQVKTPAQLNSEANGLLTKSVAGNTNVVLTATEAANGMLDFTGTLTGNISIIVPAASRRWVMRNRTTGNYTLTVKTQNGAGVLIKQGLRDQIWCDGADVIRSTNSADLSGAAFTGPISATAMDSTPIGQTTPAAVSATTLTTTGNAGISNPSPSARLTVGAATATGATLHDTVLMAGYSTAPQLRYIFNHAGSGLLGFGSDGVGSLIFGRTTAATGAVTNEFGRFSGNGNLLAGQTTDTGVKVQIGGFNDSSFASSTGLGVAGNSHFQGSLRLDGILLAGATSATMHTITISGLAEGAAVAQIYSGAGGVVVYAAGGTGANAAAMAMRVDKNSTTGRSINAGGTINASGADYAEYMRKAENCGQIAKGAIVGVNADGKLTDKWAEAVSFLIKTTNPSYVGGDTWGSYDALGMSRPVEPQFTPPSYDGAADPGEPPLPPVEPEESAGEDQIAAYVEALDQYQQAAADYERVKSNFEQDQAAYAARVEIAKQIFDTATYPAYLQELETFEAALEAARQKVDRIAFAGQVPVNVKGAKPGQYVVPVQNGEGIAGMLVSDTAISFEQYRRAVGVVQNIFPDGRANVRVKVV